jgi:SAM-dependent methyltransferase
VVEVVRLLNLWGLESTITGVDLNSEMLRVAMKRSIAHEAHAHNVTFTKADATQADDLPRNVDIVTQVFGIGGIPNPIAVFAAVLQTLTEGGEYYLVDMHRPIAELPAEVPLLWQWWQVPTLEATTYFKTTIPLALARLWGWRDTTLDFYQAPLATLCQDGVWYGFETLWFKHEPERWWFSLPVMPTARLLLRKIRISEEEARRRNHVRIALGDDLQP